MTRPLHIVFIHPTLAYQGGAELSLLWLAAGLDRLGQKITIITGSVDDGLVSGLPPSIALYNIDKSTDPDDWLTLPPLIMGILEKADIISPHNYPSYLWLAGVDKSGPPVVLFCQEPPQSLYARTTQRHFLAESSRDLGGFLPGLSQSTIRVKVLVNKLRRRQEVDRQAISKCSMILANSAFTADNIRRIHNRRAEVCHLGIPDYISGGSKTTAEHECSTRESTRQILLPGRLSAIKNAGIALEALFLVQNHHYGLLKPGGVTIIGEGWQQKFLASKLTTLDLSEIVELRELVSHQEMRAIYQQHQVILYIPFDEPFGLVSIEAMASCRPVIGSNQGGIIETIRDGETGLLVPPHSSEDIYQALVKLLENKDLCHSMGQAGYTRFRQNFTLDRFVNTFLNYCHQVA